VHRRRMIWIVIVLLAVVFATSLSAQTITTGPISTTNTVAWTQANEASAAAAQALQYRMRVDVPVAGPFLLLGVATCIATTTATSWDCTTAVTQALADAVNVRGQHVLTLTAYDPTAKLESPAALPFSLTSPPSAPTAVRIIP